MENTSIAQQWIYANYIENDASSNFIFMACNIATELIRLFPAYYSFLITGLHATLFYIKKLMIYE
jgi:hypothetical protein